MKDEKEVQERSSIATYTPAPWRVEVERSIRYVYSATSRIVATAESMLDGINNAEREREADANARLIAAAPDLYQALRLMLADVEAYQANPHGHRPTSRVAQARAALALVTANAPERDAEN